MNEKQFSIQPIKTKELLFREPKIEDTSDIFCLYSDPGVLSLDRSEPFKNLIEAEELIRVFKQMNQRHDSIIWLVELMESKKVIGSCGFKNWDRLSHHAEIGGNISSNYWSKGYGSETLKFLLDYGFTKMYLNKIYGYTNAKNKNVLKLLNRHGFQQEGILRDHQLLNGTYDDVFVFSILKREYKEGK
ncbi:GNAT family N-acetyltransferase [Bacillus sp. FJAT-45350]|uniref:GNAT family N-acetyltransferase n=1 Tax=Bacillus sp. FJAT-45350 TaxID=2011014 RepID=UPI0015C95A48|nr:GNAT family protein [Bacillus sp. FJAT-45350]